MLNNKFICAKNIYDTSTQNTDNMQSTIYDITMSTYEEKNIKELEHEIMKIMKIYDEFGDSQKYIKQLDILVNIAYDFDYSKIIVREYGERLLNHFVYTYNKNNAACEAKKYSVIATIRT